MTGITGIFKKNSNATGIEKLLPKMCQAMKHENWYKTDTFSNKQIEFGRVSLGILNLENQPIFNEDRSLCIIMEGEIYDYSELKKELNLKGHKFSINNDPEFVLHLYEEYGKSFVRKLNGSFILAIWDNKKQELTIANDYYGTKLLYYTEQNRYLLFGSEIKAILEDNNFRILLDDIALSEFFCFGYVLGNKTFIKDIKSLPPASIMTCKDGKISVENYYPLDIEEDKRHSKEYHIERLSELILQAVERRMKGDKKIGLLLSGGFDSRLIAGSIDKKHYPIHAFTWGEQKCNDVLVAKAIARRLGMEHHIFDYKPQDLIENAEKAIFITDGMLDFSNTHGTINRVQKVKKYCDIILNGYAGGEILGADEVGREVFSSKNEEQFIKAMYNQLKGSAEEETLEALFNNSCCKKAKNAPYESIRRYLKKYKNKSYSIRCQLFTLRDGILNCFGKYGLSIWNSQVEYRTPFFDNDLMDAVLRIPKEYKREHKIYREVMIKLFPSLCRIPIERDELPVNANYIQIKKQKARKLFKRLTNKYCGIYSKENYFADYHLWLRENKELRKYVKGILMDPKAKSRHYLRQEFIQKTLEEEFTGKKNNAPLISRLISFELWNRLFLDKRQI